VGVLEVRNGPVVVRLVMMSRSEQGSEHHEERR